jgi:hypothetical protein
MVRQENLCCDCATESYPCKGDSCCLRHVRVLLCDKCGAETDKLYIYGSQELCAECLLEECEVIE